MLGLVKATDSKPKQKIFCWFNATYVQTQNNLAYNPAYAPNGRGLFRKAVMQTMEYFLEDWSTDEHPNVVIDYEFLEGDASVGLADDFEIYVYHGDKEIWGELTRQDQIEIQEAVEADYKRVIDEWNQP